MSIRMRFVNKSVPKLAMDIQPARECWPLAGLPEVAIPNENHNAYISATQQ
jgi:hypothetical protein